LNANQKYNGQVIRLDATGYEPVWNDMTLTWDEVQPYVISEQGVTTANPTLGGIRETILSQGIADKNINESADSKIIESRTSLFNESASKLQYPSLYRFDNLANKDASELTWHITHSDKSIDYCYKLSGKYADVKSIILFLPYIGFYDVKLTTYDNNNFPQIVYKEKYIEVVGVQDDIIAFGSFINKIDSELSENTTWDDWNSNYDDDGMCPLASRIEELNISWDDMNYGRHKQQDFAYYNLRKSEVIGVAGDYVYLQGRDFYNDWLATRNTNYRDVTLFARDSSEVYSAEFVPILQMSNNIALIDTNYMPKVDEKLVIYRDHIFNEFSILTDENCILIRGIDTSFVKKFPDTIIVGMEINLYEANYKRRKKFIITDIVKNYINNTVKIFINDDGSLNFQPVNKTDEFGNPYNISDWRILRIKEIFVESRIKTVTTKTTFEAGLIPTELEFPHYIREVKMNMNDQFKRLKKIDISDFKIDFGIYSGWFVLPLTEKLNSEYVENVSYDNFTDRTAIRITDDRYLNQIDTNWHVCWNDFDFDWAVMSTKVDGLTWDSVDDMLIDNLYHQSYDMLDFRNDSIFSFELKNIENINTSYLQLDVEKPQSNAIIYFNDVEVPLVLPRYPRENYFNSTTTNAIIDERNWKYTKATEILNNIKQGPASYFKYYKNGTNSIIAISKKGGLNSLYKLKYKIITGSESTYPFTNWTDFHAYFFKGQNNVASWNRFANDYNEFKNTALDDVTIENFDRVASGSFNWNNTFIKSENFDVPRGTPVFFQYYNGEMDFDIKKYEYNHNKIELEIDNDKLEYVWTLTDETTKVVLIKTTSEYLNWLFKIAGKYTINLEIKGVKFNKIIEKKSFINVY
jgi:hypothetical protein